MPRYAELPEAMTPFGQVLTDYMWNRRPPNRPPLTTSQLAVRLGIPRQSVNNWIYKGNVPTIEAVLAILAQLDIPLRELYDAYHNAGITVPRWDDSDPNAPVIQGNPVAERKGKQTTVPIPTDTDDAPAPRPYTPPPATSAAQAEADDWQRMIDQTADALREEGLPEHAIKAAIQHLRAQQSLPPDARPIQQNLIAEHSEPSEQHDQPDQPDQAPSTPSTRDPRSTSGSGSGSGSGATQRRRHEPRSAALR